MKYGLDGIVSEYGEYRRRLDAREVLARYGAENCTEQINRKDGTTEIVHSCLLDRVEPHHRNKDQNPSAWCLPADSVIHLRQGKKQEWAHQQSVGEIYRLWHEGIPHSYREGKAYRKTSSGKWAACVNWQGEVHRLGTFDTEKEVQEVVDKFRDEHPYEGRRKYHKNVRARSWDVDGDMYARTGQVLDVWEAGVKPLVVITTESGKILRCTPDHPVLTDEGWVEAGLISSNDWVFREGRGRDQRKGDREVPRYLREAIGHWSFTCRRELILHVDICHVCNRKFLFDDLELDHVVPVSVDLRLALDKSNLRPICKECHQSKSVAESKNSFRPGTQAKAIADRVVSITQDDEEMTYDLSVDTWKNFTANGLIVHNCNVDKNLYVCSAYWSGDLLTLIQKLERKDSIADALPIVGEMLKGATRERDEFAAVLAKLIHRDQGRQEAMTAYNPRVLDAWAFIHPYMLERGITADVHRELRVGYDGSENRIVIPHFWDGNLVGWQKRAIPDRPGQWPGSAEQWPKYRSSSGFPKSETLFGFDYPRSVGDEVIVVESPMSVLKAHSLGIANVTATFGAKVTKQQADLLADFGHVVVWFDHDAAGYHGGRQLVESLYRRTRVTAVDPDPDHDLGDYMTGEAVHDKLETARPAVLWLADREVQERRAREEADREAQLSRGADQDAAQR